MIYFHFVYTYKHLRRNTESTPTYENKSVGGVLSLLHKANELCKDQNIYKIYWEWRKVVPLIYI